MHRCGTFLLSLLPVKPRNKAPKELLLSSAESARVRLLLLDDARDSFYSACVSFVDGLRGIQQGFYTWATVKLYYSVFYAMRSRLAIDGICVFYYNSKSFWIEGQPGAAGSGAAGGTHEAALHIFLGRYPTHRLLAQPIGGIDPFQWLMARREDSNYKVARFVEPGAPSHFAQIERIGIRQAIVIYLNDNRDQYMFDQEHAMVAYPLAVLAEIGRELAPTGGAGISEEELGFLRTESKDQHGLITPLGKFFRDIA